jgi:putative ABC transport system permease protein
MTLLFHMAWRNIWRNRMRSVVILLSISIGLFAGLAVLSLYKGMMADRIKTVIYSEIGHIQLHAPGFIQEKETSMLLPKGKQILADLTKLKEIKFICPRVIIQGMFSTTNGSAGIQINGVDPINESRVSSIEKKIIHGHYFTGKKNEILVGKKLADKLKLHTGSKIVLTFTDSHNELVSGAFRIGGIYQSVNAPLDERNVFVKEKDLRNIAGIGEGIHEIAVILKEDEQQEKLINTWKMSYPGLDIAGWQQLSPETNLLVKTVDDYSYVIIVIIMLALAFGITNTMLMAVLERSREIGMMMALGTSQKRIGGLIIIETILLTIAGTPLGLVAGWLLIDYFSKTGLDLASNGKDLMASFGFSSRLYPVFPTEKLVPIFLIVSITALLSSIIPVIKILRMKPANAIRI